MLFEAWYHNLYATSVYDLTNARKIQSCQREETSCDRKQT